MDTPILIPTSLLLMLAMLAISRLRRLGSLLPRSSISWYKRCLYQAKNRGEDVAEILGYRDAFNMVRRLDEDEKGTHFLSTPGGDQEITIINESGFYNAALGSTKPEGNRVYKKFIS